MKKASRYFLALLICIGIFALWIVFQMYVAKGALVGILFCSAMFSVWKAIVRGDEVPVKEPKEEEHSETIELHLK